MVLLLDDFRNIHELFGKKKKKKKKNTQFEIHFMCTCTMYVPEIH